MVVPGAALSTAFWMDCPGPSTIVRGAAADAPAAAPALSTNPAAVTETLAINLRMLRDLLASNSGEFW
jgi:hypothetical protein